MSSSGEIVALWKGLYPGWNREFGASGKDSLHFAKLIGIEDRFAREELDRFYADYPQTNRPCRTLFSVKT